MTFLYFLVVLYHSALDINAKMSYSFTLFLQNSLQEGSTAAMNYFAPLETSSLYIFVQ